MCSKHQDVVSRAVVRSLEIHADPSFLRQNLLERLYPRSDVDVSCADAIRHVLRFEMELVGCAAWLRELPLLTSRGIDELEPLGVSDAHKHRDFRRDGENAQSKHRGAGHFNTTWQSSEGDVCLGFACSGCALIARHFCSARGHGCWDCDWGTTASGNQMCWWGKHRSRLCWRQTVVNTNPSFCDW